MSNRLTFSLASLILILGLVFATAPAMAVTTDTSVGISGSVGSTNSRFATIVHQGGNTSVSGAAANTEIIQTDSGSLPDLDEAFIVGTTIALLAPANEGLNDAVISATNPAVMAKDVVISEIMWGIDTGATDDTDAFAAQKYKQWIEFYNTTATPTPAVTTDWILYFVDDYNDIPTPAEADVAPDPSVPATTLKVKNVVSLDLTDDNTANPVQYVLVDIVSNHTSAGGGWTNDIGQSGNTVPAKAKDLISMYRNINYENATKQHQKDGKDLSATDNRTEQLKAIPSGIAKGSWKASQRLFQVNQKGSPGKQHFAGKVTILTASTVNLKKVIINEIGNSEGDKYDWLELRNTSGADLPLENYELSNVVGTTKKDVSLVIFPKITIPKDDVLLVVNTDPKLDAKHPLAAGVNVITEEGANAGDLVKNGLTSRYYVNSGFKIPNDHVLFILRSVKEKLGTNGDGLKALVDVTGTASIADNANTLATNLWPLVKTAAVNNEIIKGAKVADGAKFGDGTVYRRNKADKTTNDKEIWVASEDAGGIGYKRDMPGKGTPGYANGALKTYDKASGDDGYVDPLGKVTISEIMYDSGNKLPQWIELYNPSMTEAVNINDWRLKLENPTRDGVFEPGVDMTFAHVPMRSTVTVKLASKIIPPNQTVLIVSTTARNSGNFPSHRVLDLWKDGLKDKDKLEIAEGTARRDFRFLSEYAFKITLMDAKGNNVDTAGNMGASSWWPLPINDDGRSSIIRRYNTGKTTQGGKMAQDGTLRVWTGMANTGDDEKDGGKAGDAGWVLASASDLNHTVTETYYGHDTDIGSPGYRGGGALPVSLSKFRPERLKDTGEIVIRWITESELNNAGFNILRSETRNGEFIKINTSLIAGQGTTSERTTYEWKDSTAKPTVVYYYQIQDVSLDGQVQTLRMSRLKGDITPAGKLTTTWGALKALQ